MRLYHYSTWKGVSIIESGNIEPTNFYGRYAVSKGVWPALVFLTSDPYWDSSVQSRDSKEEWIKGSSSPEEYTKNEIPCFKFEVEIKEPLLKLMYSHPYWLKMLMDGKDLGSDISRWHWTDKSCQILKVYQWINGGWLELLRPLTPVSSSRNRS